MTDVCRVCAGQLVPGVLVDDPAAGEDDEWLVWPRRPWVQPCSQCRRCPSVWAAGLAVACVLSAESLARGGAPWRPHAAVRATVAGRTDEVRVFVAEEGSAFDHPLAL